MHAPQNYLLKVQAQISSDTQHQVPPKHYAVATSGSRHLQITRYPIVQLQ